jgi:type I restriction enzyme, S subunit
MSDWTSTALRECVELIGGNGFPEDLQGGVTGDIPFFKVSDMNSVGNEQYLVAAANRVEKVTARGNGWRSIPANSVVFAKVGAALLLNRRRILSTDSLVDNNMMGAVPLDCLDARWLYHWLQTIDFASLAQVGALPSINQRDVGSLRFRRPPLEEQRRIAEILDTIDETIQATERVITKLGEIATGTLERMISTSEGQAVAVGSMGTDDRSAVRSGPFGSMLKAEHWTDFGIPVVTIGSLGDTSFTDDEFLYVNDRTAETLRAFKLVEGDLVFSRVADVGRALVVPARGEGWLMSSNLIRVSPDRRNVLPTYLWLALTRDLRVKAQLRRQISTGGRDVASSPLLRGIQVVLPAFEDQRKTVDAYNSFDERSRIENLRLSKMMRFRAGLAADLLSGRVRTVAS